MRFWLAWIHGGGTFHDNIIPPWDDYSRGDIFRRRRPALASPRRRHHRAIRYDSCTQQSWSAANNRRTAPRAVSVRPGTAPCLRTNGTQKRNRDGKTPEQRNFRQIIYRSYRIPLEVSYVAVVTSLRLIAMLSGGRVSTPPCSSGPKDASLRTKNVRF